MGKSKQIYLMTGTKEGWKWRFSFSVSKKQQKWSGSFDFCAPKKYHAHKTIHLTSGSENGFPWLLILHISANQCEWGGSFYLADETRKYRQNRRAKDRYWAKKMFPLQWLEQFEIHHHWSDETCYFLTKDEHCERDRQIRYTAP